MSGVVVWVCEAGHAAFPQPLLCGTCGSRDLREELAHEGTLEQATDVRAGTIEVRIGSVRTALGPVVIVRLEGEAEPGSTVVLDRADGAIVAR